jgi:hypothetical protein
MTSKKRGDQYVERVREETRQYLHEMLLENERLRSATASLESERARLTSERLRLQEQLLEARDQLDRHRAESELLRLQVESVQRENRRFADDYVRVERQNANLANLYVASYRLHGTVDRSEILEALKEIVINLVGSEDAAVYEISPDGEALVCATAVGPSVQGREQMPVGAGPIGETVRTGTVFVSNGNTDLVACIPLRIEKRCIGAIAIFGLLQQKVALDELDRELFEMLATHAATALYCANLHESNGGGVH